MAVKRTYGVIITLSPNHIVSKITCSLKSTKISQIGPHILDNRIENTRNNLEIRYNIYLIQFQCRKICPLTFVEISHTLTDRNGKKATE